MKAGILRSAVQVLGMGLLLGLIMWTVYVLAAIWQAS